MKMPFDVISETPDEALLVLYANGDPLAARELAARYLPLVMGFATRMLSGDRAEAEDVAQEAMLRLWRIAPDWRQGEAKISTWLYRVVSNLCTDRLRGRTRRRAVGLDEAPDIADDVQGVEASLMDRDRMDALNEGLASLPERQRQAVVLRHIEGLSNPEIAQVMDIGVEAVESLTARGKRALATAMAGRRAELGYEEGT
ncbi:RNA polymerase sigma factor [Pseudorhodobacter aquimaris]|uniref:RNA polymerase sigma factor n=1 Tax=Pseudorhodobacter aquimaris TaxID=687412 RepID=UPI00067DDEF2|nr:RNA polymerase sigma factor [Pseudorhodobacter aquimaris]